MSGSERWAREPLSQTGDKESKHVAGGRSEEAATGSTPGPAQQGRWQGEETDGCPVVLKRKHQC